VIGAGHEPTGVEPPRTVCETVLYAEDVVAAAAFYRDVLGLTPIEEPGELGAFFRLGGGAMLLVFDPHHSAHDPPTTGQLYVRDPAGNSVELVEGEIWT
jgi:catechol 2,3-dioxygenase-like lactoylglutathione lyase family enzyme